MESSLGDLIREANARVLVEADLSAISSFFSEGYVAHRSQGDPLRGHEWIARFVSALQASFADLSVRVEVLMGAEDRVAWYRQVRGQHARSFQGFPATNAAVSWRDMVVSRFQDGLIVEEWVVSDLAEQLLRATKRS